MNGDHFRLKKWKVNKFIPNLTRKMSGREPVRDTIENFRVTVTEKGVPRRLDNFIGSHQRRLPGSVPSGRRSSEIRNRVK